ncbi:MAG: hypothetical protein AMJ53_16620 [Gammaproteobacteria bacterium SG8_11]|nr:MAG: hypothetical protein AMJ53_16620 [Gammaproteobacteria bacterium SG8_11]
MTGKSRNFRTVVVLISLLVAVRTYGDDSSAHYLYVLEEGEHVEVCKAYLLNLNSFSDRSTTMACEREINPTFKDFGIPELTQLDVWESRELLKEIELYLGEERTYGNPEKDLIDWENTLKSRIRKNIVNMLYGKLDIDNDGKEDVVLYYKSGRCGETSFYGTAILVLNDTLASIDRQKTLYLMQNPRLINDRDSGGWAYSMYDVFTYKGISYFDRWNDPTTEFNVYLLKDGTVNKVCAFDYLGATTAR